MVGSPAQRSGAILATRGLVQCPPRAQRLIDTKLPDAMTAQRTCLTGRAFWKHSSVVSWWIASTPGQKATGSRDAHQTVLSPSEPCETKQPPERAQDANLRLVSDDCVTTELVLRPTTSDLDAHLRVSTCIVEHPIRVLASARIRLTADTIRLNPCSMRRPSQLPLSCTLAFLVSPCLSSPLQTPKSPEVPREENTCRVPAAQKQARPRLRPQGYPPQPICLAHQHHPRQSSPFCCLEAEAKLDGYLGLLRDRPCVHLSPVTRRASNKRAAFAVLAFDGLMVLRSRRGQSIAGTVVRLRLYYWSRSAK